MEPLAKPLLKNSVEPLINCIFNGNEYKKISIDTIAGLFIAAEIDNNKFPSVLIDTTPDLLLKPKKDDSFFKVLTSLKPQSKFLNIETNYIDIKNDVLTSLKDFQQIILLYKILIISSNRIILFDNEDILKGISKYFLSRNYPNIRVFRIKSQSLKEIKLMFDVVNNGKDDYVLEKIVHINLRIPNNKGIIDIKKIKFDSLDHQGWKRNDIFDNLYKGYIELAKSKGLIVDTNISCSKLIDLGEGVYDPVYDIIKK